MAQRGRGKKGMAVDIEATEVSQLALSLRRTGLSYRAIATQMGMSLNGVYKAVKRELDALHESCTEEAQQVRAIELQRLDVMTESVWDKAKSGNMPAIDMVLRVMDRRARLLGLDKLPEDTANHVFKFFLGERPPDSVIGEDENDGD